MRLRFRRIGSDDLGMIMNWRTMPEVSSYMYTDFKPDIEKQKSWFETISMDKSRLDWIINLDNEDVGLVSIVKIDRLNQRCEWAYYLASPNVRGKGVGRSVEINILSYVFDELNLNKLCCEVFVANDKVIKIHEKYGSQIEGTRREQVRKDGRFHDIVEMGILRSEWEEKVKGKVEFVAAEFDIIDKEKAGVGCDV